MAAELMDAADAEAAQSVAEATRLVATAAADSQRAAQEEVRVGSARAEQAIEQAQQQAVARVDAIRKEASRWVKVRSARRSQHARNGYPSHLSTAAAAAATTTAAAATRPPRTEAGARVPAICLHRAALGRQPGGLSMHCRCCGCLGRRRTTRPARLVRRRRRPWRSSRSGGGASSAVSPKRWPRRRRWSGAAQPNSWLPYAPTQRPPCVAASPNRSAALRCADAVRSVAACHGRAATHDPVCARRPGAHGARARAADATSGSAGGGVTACGRSGRCHTDRSGWRGGQCHRRGAAHSIKLALATAVGERRRPGCKSG